MTLFIVATPIGNLEDITLRALNILKEVDLIAAEDTRHSKKLLTHFKINTAMISYHSHSGQAKVDKIIAHIKAGKKLALISDAGTPGISDPAWTLIQAALNAEIKIVPIPGASAFLTALMACGLPMNQFNYLGFLPAKKGRHSLFTSLLDANRTSIFYESPHRLLKTLKQLEEILGPDRSIVIARELTKLHETFYRGTTFTLLEQFNKQKPKGEIVILIAPQNFTWS